MLPDNYYPKAGDMIKLSNSLCVFVASGKGLVALVRFSDRYEKGALTICLSSDRNIPTNEVYKYMIEPSELLGHVDFDALQKAILNET